MNSFLKTLVMGVALAIATVVVAPQEAEAQCESPEHCQNGETEQACDEGSTVYSWEECDLVGGFCQLSGARCDGQTFMNPDFPADLDVTPAGTFRTVVPLYAVATAGLDELRSCDGLVVVPADPWEKKPDVIILD